MKYGDKRDYRKIEIFVDGVYVATTTWAKSLTVAKDKYVKDNAISRDRIQVDYADK